MPDNNHTTKASVFEDLFSDKEYLFQLYKVLHPEDVETTIDLIQEVTLSNIFLRGMYNDLGMMVGDNILSQYITFCKVYDEQRTKYPEDGLFAITETIRFCSEKDVLAAYLKAKEKEVKSIMLTLFSQEEARRMEIISERKEAKAEGRAEGIEKGINYISQLMNALLSANRVEDAMRASTDSAYCSQLLAEYGLA